MEVPTSKVECTILCPSHIRSAALKGGEYFQEALHLAKPLLDMNGDSRLWLVHDTTGTSYVMKSYIKAQLTSLRRRQVEREIEIHSALSHPNIVPLYAWWTTSTCVNLLMEHVPGGDLFDVVKSGICVPEKKAIRTIVLPLLRALEYIHELGIVHRDIKLENVLRTADSVKLCDFGLAICTEAERAVTRLGTLGYMPPEVLRAQPKIDPTDNKDREDLEYTSAADVFSLGVLAYELVTGRPPFESTNINMMLIEITRTHPIYPTHVSEECQDFIGQAMNPDPNLRPTISALLHHRWVSNRQPAASLPPGIAAAMLDRRAGSQSPTPPPATSNSLLMAVATSGGRTGRRSPAPAGPKASNLSPPPAHPGPAHCDLASRAANKAGMAPGASTGSGLATMASLDSTKLAKGLLDLYDGMSCPRVRLSPLGANKGQAAANHAPPPASAAGPSSAAHASAPTGVRFNLSGKGPLPDSRSNSPSPGPSDIIASPATVARNANAHRSSIGNLPVLRSGGAAGKRSASPTPPPGLDASSGAAYDAAGRSDWYGPSSSAAEHDVAAAEGGSRRSLERNGESPAVRSKSMVDHLTRMFNRNSPISSGDAEHGPLSQSPHGHHSHSSGTGTPEPSLYGPSRGVSGINGASPRTSLDNVPMRSRGAQVKSNLSQAAGPSVSGGGPSSTLSHSGTSNIGPGTQRSAASVPATQYSERAATLGRKSLGARPNPTPEGSGAPMPVQVQRQVQAASAAAGGPGGSSDRGLEADIGSGQRIMMRHTKH